MSNNAVEYARKKAIYFGQILAHYGSFCACCGTTDNLTLDHIEPERRKNCRGWDPIAAYKKVIDDGFPAGYQILCKPCNTSKGTLKACTLIHGINGAYVSVSGNVIRLAALPFDKATIKGIATDDVLPLVEKLLAA